MSPHVAESKEDLTEDSELDPMRLFAQWSTHARQSGRYDDWNAMALATSTLDGAPSVRMVLCKSIEASPPALVFYTSYESQKGRELEANPRAAATFHWPHAQRQVRVEGNVTRVSAAESDAYFDSRPMISRIGSAVSHQSAPIEARAVLLTSALALAGQVALQGRLVRPARWGGYRLHVATIELWSARDGRLHDRVKWTRQGSADAASWSAVRLSP